MFDIDFGLAAAERQRENDLPHKKTLYHCDSCGGEIYEGETCYYNGMQSVGTVTVVYADEQRKERRSINEQHL